VPPVWAVMRTNGAPAFHAGGTPVAASTYLCTVGHVDQRGQEPEWLRRTYIVSCAPSELLVRGEPGFLGPRPQSIVQRAFGALGMHRPDDFRRHKTFLGSQSRRAPNKCERIYDSGHWSASLTRLLLRWQILPSPACVPLPRPSRRTVKYDCEGLGREALSGRHRHTTP